jgi:hypothetical protein
MAFVIYHPNRRQGRRMAMALLTRTAEQQARFEYLINCGHLWTPDESAEYAALERMVACPPTATPVATSVVGTPDPLPPAPSRTRISVKVGRDPRYEAGRGYWIVEVKVDGSPVNLPDKDIIRGFLPQGDKVKLARGRRYRNVTSVLSGALNAGLSPQSLHDALKAWAVAANSPVRPAESDFNLDDETSYLLHAQPATLEVGGKVFKLVPAGEIDVRPLIKRIRVKALAGARAEAVTITSKAKVDARLVVSSAENSAASIRAEVEVLRREISSQLPNWVKVSGRPAIWAGNQWWVGLNVSCRVKEIRFTVNEWHTVLYWNPVPYPIDMNEENRAYYWTRHKMRLWVRLNPEGRYTLDDVRHLVDGFSTVHSDGRVCMSLQGLPSTLTSREHLISLENAISRGMQVVNLNSPLNRDYNNFYPDFKGQIPVIVRKWLTGNIIIAPTRTGQEIGRWMELNPNITWDRVESLEQEGMGVFNTEQYQPTPLAPPVIPTETVEDIARMIAGGEHATRR